MMTFINDNLCLSVRVSLTLLQKCGLWQPSNLNEKQKKLYNAYTVLVYMLMTGSFIITQVIDLLCVWGNLPLMTADAFLLFTLMAHNIKIFNLLYRREKIQSIIDGCNQALREALYEEKAKAKLNSCDKVTTVQMYTLLIGPLFTILVFAVSSEKKEFPVRAWYPYDATVSPVYELTYAYQVVAMSIGAILNACKDNLATTLIAQCRCRLQLLGLSLRSLCQDLKTDLLPLTPEQENIVSERLRRCVEHHQAVLEEVLRIEECFALPIFSQFAVSLAIICATDFQIISQHDHPVRVFSMVTYLFNMTMQVFVFCYHGNQLSEESSKIADYAYECPWYLFSVRLRRVLLIIMTRARRLAIISVAGLSTLSLTSFTSIIKASYSLFTLLQNVDEKK